MSGTRYRSGLSSGSQYRYEISEGYNRRKNVYPFLMYTDGSMLFEYLWKQTRKPVDGSGDQPNGDTDGNKDGKNDAVKMDTDASRIT